MTKSNGTLDPRRWQQPKAERDDLPALPLEANDKPETRPSNEANERKAAR